MADQNLVNYIRQAQAQGFSKEEIEKTLLEAGWQAAQIKEGFASLLAPPRADIKVEYTEPGAIKTSGSTEPTGGLMSFVRSKYLYIAIICAIGLGGLGVGAYGYFFPSPEKVIGQATQNMAADVNSFKYTFNLTFGNEWASAKKAVSLFEKNLFGAVVSAIGESQKLADLPIDTGKSEQTLFSSGSFDFTDKESQKIDAMFEVGGLNFLGLSVRLDLKKIGKDVYLKLNNLSGLEEQLNGLSGQWFRFNEQDIKEAAKVLGLESILEEYKKEVGVKNDETELTAEQEEKLKNLAKETQFFSVKEKMPDEVLYETGSETKAFHYAIQFNEAGIKKYISDGFGIMEMEKQYSQIKTIMEDGIEELAKAKTEVWIGKKDRLMHKVSVNFEENNEESKNKTHASINLSLFNFNEPLTIEKPAEFKTAKDLAEIYLVSMEKARKMARDARREADIHQIRIAMEMYFDSNNGTYLNLPDAPAPVPANSQMLEPYLSSLPSDPKNEGDYVYFWTDTGKPRQGYCIWAKLEDQNSGQYALVNVNGFKETTVAPTKENCFSL